MTVNPTPTQVRHLQNQLESLTDKNEHHSALTEGAKSWTWEKVRERLREKRRTFDYQVVEAFESSTVPTPDDLYGHLDTVWKEEVLDELPSTNKSILRTAIERTVTEYSVIRAVAGPATRGGPAVVYAELILNINRRWKAYYEECIRIAKEDAGSYLKDQ
jgi:hypothetical protein